MCRGNSSRNQTLVYDVDTLEYLKAKVGGDKFMLGTDYPYTLGDWLAVEKIHALKCSVAEKDAIGRQC